MERSNMLIVAEGILDSAAEEYLESNLENWSAVDNYASNGCEIHLSREECEKVLAVCREWLAAESPTSNDYSTIVELPLSVEQVIQTRTFYAIANANGMISKRIEAASKYDALAMAEASGREWIDDPTTDAEDVFGFDCADKSSEECRDLLAAAGLTCVMEGATVTDWDIWA